jgi:hypothetical protein
MRVLKINIKIKRPFKFKLIFNNINYLIALFHRLANFRSFPIVKVVHIT